MLYENTRNLTGVIEILMLAGSEPDRLLLRTCITLCHVLNLIT